MSSWWPGSRLLQILTTPVLQRREQQKKRQTGAISRRKGAEKTGEKAAQKSNLIRLSKNGMLEESVDEYHFRRNISLVLSGYYTRHLKSTLHRILESAVFVGNSSGRSPFVKRKDQSFLFDVLACKDQ